MCLIFYSLLRRYYEYNFENNDWNRIYFKDKQVWDASLLILPNVGVTNQNFKLSTLKDFNSLTPGKYRIVKELGNEEGLIHVTAEFELQ